MLRRLLAPGTEPAYVLLRFFAGLLFAFHGAQILFGIFMERPSGLQIQIGGAIELATGILMAIGLFTSWAAFLASGTMAVAYYQFHWHLQMDRNFFPAVNNGEPALLNALLFLYIACRGAGAWSVDRRRARAAAAST